MGDFAANRVVAFLWETGATHGNITVKSDQQRAIFALVREFA